MNQALPPDALDKHKKAATKQAERIIQVSGRVQGVGFRPYVWQLANQLGLNGDVCNDGGQVRIRVSGATVQLDEFIRRLPDEAPELARIHSVEVLANSEFSFDLSSCESGHDSDCESGFQILPSSDSHSLQQRAIAPDTAPCEHCLNELFDPGNRRYGYPFINCTQCGPRYSLMRQLPYDRANTSMAEFELCDACGEEYQNPADRRFHAQPNACSSCGPEVWFESFYGQSHEQPFEKAEGLSSIESVIDQTLSAIARGEIVGIRGVGGFHLVCDARNPEAIARLRQRKQRPTKPLAVMVANLASAQAWAHVSEAAAEELTSSAAPIVLMKTRLEQPDVLQQLAPGLNALGLMLPHSPLHWLLFHAAAGRPAGQGWRAEFQNLALVMTSGNPSGSPLLTDNEQARTGMAGIADHLLLHNRDIVQRIDDSVVSCLSPSLPAQRIRIGRGLAPLALHVPLDSENKLATALALGSYLKNTLALGALSKSVLNLTLSQHVGDLDHPDNCRRLEETLEQLSGLMASKPARVACDLHPEGFSRLFAEKTAERLNAELTPVPHHVAHLAALLVEPELNLQQGKPLLGLALDGFGLGWDGKARGGELIRLDLPTSTNESGARFSGLGSLPSIMQPGGDKAAREPWRMALAALKACDLSASISNSIAQKLNIEPMQLAMIERQLEQNINSPETTSAGRWFDAVAGLLGLCSVQHYEGEAAMRLQAAAESLNRDSSQLLNRDSSQPLERSAPMLWALEFADGQTHLDIRPLFAAIAQGVVKAQPAAELAWLWHQQLAAALADWLRFCASEQGCEQLLMSGGCIQNSLLLELIQTELKGSGLQLITPTQVPANDGGLAVGQLIWSLLNGSSAPESGSNKSTFKPN